MRESLGIAISEACGIKTMKCKLVYILKEEEQALLPSMVLTLFLWKLQTSAFANQFYLSQ